MNVDVDEFAVVNLQNPRKRERNEVAWKKNRAKRARYSGKGKLYNDKIKRFFSKINFG